MSQFASPEPPTVSMEVKRRKQTLGFTLVELLVVVSVISLIVALLFPALKGMIKRAQGVQCLANVRGLGGSCMTYASDNDGFLPSPNLSDTTHVNNYAITADPWKSLISAGYIATNNLKLYYCPTMSHDLYGRVKKDPSDWWRMSYLYYPDYTVDFTNTRERLGRSLMRALVTDITRFGGDTIPTFHDGKGITAFFSDGSAAFVSTMPATNWYKDVTSKYPGSTVSLGTAELTALSRKLYTNR